MISPRHPSPDAIERHRIERLHTPATAEPSDGTAEGFHHDTWGTPLGSGTTVFDRARTGIATWVPQRHSGVEVHPQDAPVAPGSVVALVTRQAGAWLLFACRVVAVTDEPDAFGFTYATLPGHPEQGHESFTVRRDPATDDVTFDIDVVWRPATFLARLAGPVSGVLQRRATERYLAAMRDWVRTG